MFLPNLSNKTPRYLKLFRPGVFLGVVLISISIILGVYIAKDTERDQARINSLITNDQKIASLSAQIKSLLSENDILRNEDTRAQLEMANQTLDKYLSLKEKSATYKTQGVDTTAIDTQFAAVADQLLAKKYSDADAALAKIDTDLEAALKTKQAADSLAKPKTTNTSSCNSVPTSGYCKLTVKTPSGSFTVDTVTANLSSVQVITDSANSEDCFNNCPTKSLQNYVKDNGGYAGINGTYFCPVDYSTCSGKVASFHFPLYNSSLSKWINQNSLNSAWPLMAFTNSSGHFYSYANNFSGLGGMEAAIGNFPGLVLNGASVVDNYTVEANQKTKGTRGGVGFKGSTIYLVIARNASVYDLADIMIAIGVTHGINLDGGGSSALYYQGSYKIGPGRSLPNALILK